jgi:hypothetical protein
MSKDTQPDIIRLVAVERGFAMGRMVEPGTEFNFATKDANGKTRKLPKWAQEASKPLPKKATATNGDLKPKDAQAAMGAKRAELAGGIADPAAASTKPNADLA